ncbi:hypothetical protein HYX10_06360 [Candidatus Woesearchaeota archaeon]|nr:hypothetical protein [Candidatus Woesearchaeota archaeon]
MGKNGDNGGLEQVVDTLRGKLRDANRTIDEQTAMLNELRSDAVSRSQYEADVTRLQAQHDIEIARLQGQIAAYEHMASGLSATTDFYTQLLGYFNAVSAAVPEALRLFANLLKAHAQAAPPAEASPEGISETVAAAAQTPPSRETLEESEAAPHVKEAFVPPPAEPELEESVTEVPREPEPSVYEAEKHLVLSSDPYVIKRRYLELALVKAAGPDGMTSRKFYDAVNSLLKSNLSESVLKADARALEEAGLVSRTFRARRSTVTATAESGNYEFHAGEAFQSTKMSERPERYLLEEKIVTLFGSAIVPRVREIVQVVFGHKLSKEIIRRDLEGMVTEGRLAVRQEKVRGVEKFYSPAGKSVSPQLSSPVEERKILQAEEQKFRYGTLPPEVRATFETALADYGSAGNVPDLAEKLGLAVRDMIDNVRLAISWGPNTNPLFRGGMKDAYDESSPAFTPDPNYDAGKGRPLNSKEFSAFYTLAAAELEKRRKDLLENTGRGIGDASTLHHYLNGMFYNEVLLDAIETANPDNAGLRAAALRRA